MNYSSDIWDIFLRGAFRPRRILCIVCCSFPWHYLQVYVDIRQVFEFFCCIAFFNIVLINILAPRLDGVLHFWRRGPMGYPIFGARGRWSTPILAPFLCQVGTILSHLGWVCGAAQSVKNFWNQLGTGTEPNRTSSGHKPNRNEPNRCYSA